jgi:uncharacterized membrane protein
MSGKRNSPNKTGNKNPGNHTVTEKKGAIESPRGRAVLEERSEFSGPLPHPEIFERYEATCPGAADRILTMAENQSNHRQQIEKSFIFSRNKQSMAGTYMAGLIAITAIICGTILLLNDKNIQGIVVIVTTAITFFGTSIYGKHENKKQMEEKEDD